MCRVVPPGGSVSGSLEMGAFGPMCAEQNATYGLQGRLDHRLLLPQLCRLELPRLGCCPGGFWRGTLPGLWVLSSHSFTQGHGRRH